MSVNAAVAGAAPARPERVVVRGPDDLDGPKGRGVAIGVLAGLASSAAAVAAAPMLMPPSYSWVSRTTSESAAQGVGGAWLARLGFLTFGLSVMALAFVAAARWGRWSAVLHYAFGAFMAAAAAFSTRAWTGARYDRTEDALHSVSATAMGFAFAAAVVAAAVHRGRRAGAGQVVVDVLAVAASVAVPLGMSTMPGADGALQRAMFAIAYLWYALAALGVLRGRSPRTGAGRSTHRSGSDGPA
jgi:uncharacterized protein DUF998